MLYVSLHLSWLRVLVSSFTFDVFIECFGLGIMRRTEINLNFQFPTMPTSLPIPFPILAWASQKKKSKTKQQSNAEGARFMHYSSVILWAGKIFKLCLRIYPYVNSYILHWLDTIWQRERTSELSMTMRLEMKPLISHLNPAQCSAHIRLSSYGAMIEIFSVLNKFSIVLRTGWLYPHCICIVVWYWDTM